MFWMFNRKPNKPEKATTQKLVWNVLTTKEDNFTAMEWGQAVYNPTTDTVNMQYVINKRDGNAEAVVMNNISIAEALAELAKLQARESVTKWQYTECSWQGTIKAAMSAADVANSFSKHPATHETLALVSEHSAA